MVWLQPAGGCCGELLHAVCGAGVVSYFHAVCGAGAILKCVGCCRLVTLLCLFVICCGNFRHILSYSIWSSGLKVLYVLLPAEILQTSKSNYVHQLFNPKVTHVDLFDGLFHLVIEFLFLFWQLLHCSPMCT